MKALVFSFEWPRLAAAKLLGLFSRRGYLASLGPVALAEVPEPRLLGPDWVIVRTRFAGICGSDVKQVFLDGARDNPLIPLISFPHVMGHEVTGTVVETGSAVTRVRTGDRVVCFPWLACAARGLPLCPACRDGHPNLCRNFTRGKLAPGIHYGTCRDVSGGFAPFLPAHESMCFPIPPAVTFEQAVLADPFAVVLHALLRAPPPPGGRVLVLGCGSLGMVLLLLLARLHPDVEVLAVDVHEHLRERVLAAGARAYFPFGGRRLVEAVGERVGTPPIVPPAGMPCLLDGVDVVYETVGDARTIEASLRVVRSRGTVALLGVSTPRRVEWTPLCVKEIALVGSMGCGTEQFDGRRAHGFDIFLDLVASGRIDPTPLVTHRFPLAAYRDAFLVAADKKRHRSIKVLFDLEA